MVNYLLPPMHHCNNKNIISKRRITNTKSNQYFSSTRTIIGNAKAEALQSGDKKILDFKKVDYDFKIEPSILVHQNNNPEENQLDPTGVLKHHRGINFFIVFSENVRYCLVRGFFREKNVIFERVNGESSRLKLKFQLALTRRVKISQNFGENPVNCHGDFLFFTGIFSMIVTPTFLFSRPKNCQIGHGQHVTCHGQISGFFVTGTFGRTRALYRKLTRVNRKVSRGKKTLPPTPFF